MFTSILLFATLTGADSAPVENDSFELLDRNQSGYLEAEEFSATVFPAENVTRIRIAKGEPATSRDIGPEEAVAMIHQLFERLDKDDDDRISRAEYDAKGDTGNVRVIAVGRD